MSLDAAAAAEEAQSWHMPPLPPPVQLPENGLPSQQFCTQLQQALLAASWAGVHATSLVMPADLLQRIVQSATAITSKEPTLVEVLPSAQQQRVTVVGDTHGQFHDVCRMFELFGPPSADRLYIFNGDFVDRGAWGVEVLALLMAYKWLFPQHVYLVRGNHESAIITQVYGFAAELKAKYGKAAKGLFTHLKRFFGSLPLAALVENSTLILHGGLFRAPPAKAKTGGKRRRSSGAKLCVGTLDDLRKASKGGQDPDPDRSLKNLVACDVLWSDPVNDPGIRVNEARGCGTVFGPDVTADFLAANGLRLIIRSHEGPDARDKRLEGDKMPPVDSGYAEDHVTESGKLVTLFSAPDYPQFMAEGEDRYRNKGAVLHLSAPDYATPQVESFEAVLPRPEVSSYYAVPSYTDDEEEEEEILEYTDEGAGSSQHGELKGDDTVNSTATAGHLGAAARDAPDAAAAHAEPASGAAAGAVDAAAAAAAAAGTEAAPVAATSSHADDAHQRSADTAMPTPAEAVASAHHQQQQQQQAHVEHPTSASGGSRQHVHHPPGGHVGGSSSSSGGGGGAAHGSPHAQDPRGASCHKPTAAEAHHAVVAAHSPRKHVVVVGHHSAPAAAPADTGAPAAATQNGHAAGAEAEAAAAGDLEEAQHAHDPTPGRPVKRQKVHAPTPPQPVGDHHQQGHH